MPFWLQFGAWSGQGILIQTVGQFVGILVLKKLLKLRDTWLLIISVATMGASQIPVAFPTNFNMYLSNWISVLANMPNPVLSSLITNYVEPEEVCTTVINV